MQMLCFWLSTSSYDGIPLFSCRTQRDMPKNGESTLVKLSRTGPDYVCLDGIPTNGPRNGQLQEVIKQHMLHLAAGIWGFEDVHIYSRPFSQPGFALFVFNDLAGERLLLCVQNLCTILIFHN